MIFVQIGLMTFVMVGLVYRSNKIRRLQDYYIQVSVGVFVGIGMLVSALGFFYIGMGLSISVIIAAWCNRLRKKTS